MGTKTIPFDATKHLKSRRAQAELLSDALETGDTGYIANALGVIARARGMADVAQQAGVTRAALYKALSRRGDPRRAQARGGAGERGDDGGEDSRGAVGRSEAAGADPGARSDARGAVGRAGMVEFRWNSILRARITGM